MADQSAWATIGALFREGVVEAVGFCIRATPIGSSTSSQRGSCGRSTSPSALNGVEQLG